MAKIYNLKSFDLTKITYHPLYTGREDRKSYAIKYPNFEQWFLQTSRARIVFNPVKDKSVRLCISLEPRLEDFLSKFERKVVEFIKSEKLFDDDVDLEQMLQSRLTDKKYLVLYTMPTVPCFDSNKESIDFDELKRDHVIRLMLKLKYVHVDLSMNRIKYDIEIAQIRLSRTEKGGRDTHPVSKYAFVETFME